MLLTPRELSKDAFQASKRNKELEKARSRIKVNMPGYTGHIRGYASGPHWAHYSGRFPDKYQNGGIERKHTDVPFATPDNMYRHASARIKTNSKNHSAFVFGDDRDRFWATTYTGEYTMPEGVEESSKPPMYDDWETWEPEERRKEYDRCFNFVGAEGTAELEMAIRTKIEQRTSGGPFALRKAFKYFDRDGSGDIDPDEFKEAMLFFGLTFTERQVMSIFGTYDDDDSGSLDYYEFIDKVIESDYKSATGKKMSVRPKTPPHRTYPQQVVFYRQMLRLKEMFTFNDEDGSHQLGADELTKFLVECGQKEPDEGQIQEVMDALDRDKNGSLSFEELWEWWISYSSDNRAGESHEVGNTGLPSEQHDVMENKGLLDKMIKSGHNKTSRPPTGAQVPALPNLRTPRPPPKFTGSFGSGSSTVRHHSDKTQRHRNFTPRCMGSNHQISIGALSPKLAPLMKNSGAFTARATTGYRV